jgi:hypothetical protein
MLAARAWWRYAVVNSAPLADLLRLRGPIADALAQHGPVDIRSCSDGCRPTGPSAMGLAKFDLGPAGNPHSRLVVSDKSVALYDGFCPFTSQALRHSTDAPIETKLGACEWESCRSLASLRNEYSSTHSTEYRLRKRLPCISPAIPIYAHRTIGLQT